MLSVRLKNIFSLKEKKRRRWIYAVFVSLLLLWFWFCLPEPLFSDQYSTVLNAENGQLLGAKITNDGQWRFPECDSIPQRFEKAILYFEDEYFYRHPGINPVSILKAIGQNLKAGKIVRGGSTLSLQVIRLSRKNKPRTIAEKLVEFALALRLEIRYSKKEILNLYASHAPFGGNVVGLEAASWRYFGRSPKLLSWGETATLAVLPNAPALIYPGKNQEKLLTKRNKLLDKLKQKGVIDQQTCELAQIEPLPGEPKPLPQITPHLLDRAIKDGYAQKSIHSTIRPSLQNRVAQIVENHHQILAQNEILNAAALVIEVETGDVLAYVGNTSCNREDAGTQVDIITAPRSSGSILKPFLYALMQKEGMLLPKTLLPDIPTRIAGFNPKNFDKNYDGAVPADNALARSLNVPAVRMLQEYGVERFWVQLKKLNLSTINKPADHYGLSLILGGAEVTLWDLGSSYAGMARQLLHFQKLQSQYDAADLRQASYVSAEKRKLSEKSFSTILEAGPSWITFEALTQMDRPLEGTNWQVFDSSKKIAWKTGTSYGHRDAWAVGINPGYVVAVWVGNADGEGRPGLTGTSAAAPVLFDIFKILPPAGWFEKPYDDLVQLPVCRESGYQASPICEHIDTIWTASNGVKTAVCPYHQLIHLDKPGQYRVNSVCYRVADMVKKSWLVLPPVMEWYYKSKNPYYRTLPPFAPGCQQKEETYMDLIYPEPGTKIYIPLDFGGKMEKTLFVAAHRQPNSTIHWHLDNEYLGSTTDIHQMEVLTNEGFHTLILVADNGEIITRRFEVVGK